MSNLFSKLEKATDVMCMVYLCLLGVFGIGVMVYIVGRYLFGWWG